MGGSGMYWWPDLTAASMDPGAEPGFAASLEDEAQDCSHLPLSPIIFLFRAQVWGR